MAADMSMWSSEAWSSAADMYLLARSREGSAEAFGELWRRHLPAAYAVANRHRGRTAAEDIVAEASARVFALIQDGKGPDEHFRAYFLSAVRSVAVDHGRRELKVVPAEDETLEDLGAPVIDSVDGLEQEFDAELIRTAFRSLSERDQRVLWHTTVEGEAPRTLAPALGMSANAVSARAMRAREALRANYLDACAQRSLPDADSDECRWAIAHLGAHVRGRLPKRQNARVEEHLRTCQHAATVAADLRAIHAEFPALIVPFVFLAGVSTAGFVNATAFVGAAAASAGSTAAAAGSAAGAVPVAPSAPPTSGIGDSLGQLAGRASALVAGVAIGVGLASATPAPVEPVVAVPAPAVSMPAPTVTPTVTPTPPPTPPPPAPSPTPTTSPVETTAPKAPARTVAPRPAPARTTPPAPRPAPTSRPPAPPAPRPTSKPAPGLSPAEASVHVVQQRESTRFLLRVRGVEGPVSISVTTPAGGELTLKNSSWACTSPGPASIRCTGQDGQAMLEQSGLDGPAPIRVVITDSTGATRTQTLSLG